MKLKKFSYLLIFSVLFSVFLFGCGSSEKKEIPEDATTQERIWCYVDALSFKKSDLKVMQGSPDADRYGISFHYDGESWDETSFIVKMFSAYVNVCQDAFALDDVHVVELFVFADMTDQKGNVESTKVFTISMEKEKFLSYNWQNLKGKKIGIDNLQTDCRTLYIHPGIFQNFNDDKFFYAG